MFEEMFGTVKYENQNLKLIYFFGVLSPGTSGQDSNPLSEDYELSGGPRVHPCWSFDANGGSWI